MKEEDVENISLEDVLMKILGVNPQLSVGVSGKPTIDWPLNAKELDQECVSLTHPKIKAGLAEFVWENMTRILHERELNRIIRVLEGIAWRNNQIHPEVGKAIEEDPFLEVLFLYLKSEKVDGKYEGSCSYLLNCLEDFASKNRITSNIDELPGGAPQLSKKLNERKAVLEQLGFQLAIGRYSKTGSRFVKIAPLDSTDDVDAVTLQQRQKGSYWNQSVKVKTDDADGDFTDLYNQVRLTTKRRKK